MIPITPPKGTVQVARARMGHYELFDRFATGDMSELYLGRARGEEGFEKLVAIKRVLPKLQDDPRFVQMLQTEARIHASLSHKNIVQIHDLGLSGEGEYFIVLEYVDGRDLATLLDAYTKGASVGNPQRLDDAVALYILSQIAEGVHFAHELRGPDGNPLGLVHRDISPSNVLLSYAGEVKLSDFGVAKRHMDSSVVHSIKGDLGYMAPEQAKGGTLDRRSDIFALGAVAFEVFTGSPLRNLQNTTDDLSRVVSGIVTSPQRFRPDIPPAIAQLLTSALAPDPRDRFADARAFMNACTQALSTIPRPPHGEASELKSILLALLPPGSKSTKKDPLKIITLMPSMWEDVTVPEAVMPPGSQGDVVGSAAPPVVRTEITHSPVPSSHTTPRPSPPGSQTPLGGTALHPAFRARLRKRKVWVVAALLVLALGVGLFHLFIVPLSVAVAYFEPAKLSIATDPHGADVSVDGKPVPGKTPVIVAVARDRQQHTIEVRKPGFLPTSYRVRYDKTLEPRVHIPLVPAPVAVPLPPLLRAPGRP